MDDRIEFREIVDAEARRPYQPDEPGAAGEPDATGRPVSRRWIVTGAALLAVLIGFRLVAAASGHHSATPPAAQVAPSPTPSAPTISSPVATINAARDPDPLAIPQFDARPGPVPAGLQALTDYPQPALVDLTTGRRTVLAGLPAAAPGLYPQFQTIAQGVLAVYPDSDGDGGSVFLVRPGQRAELIGVGASVLPGPDGSVLVTTFGPRDPPTAASSVPVQRQDLTAIDLAGHRLWSYQLPYYTDLLASTRQGLVVDINTSENGPVQLALLDPRTGHRLRELGTALAALAADEQHLLWSGTGCEGSAPTKCTINVTELATGRTKKFPITEQPASAVLSPDGTSVALGWPGRPAFNTGSYSPGHAAVMSLDTGRMQPIPGLGSAVKRLFSMAWQPDSSTVILALSWPDHWRIAFWKPGTAALTAWAGTLPATSDDQSLGLIPAK